MDFFQTSLNFVSRIKWPKLVFIDLSREKLKLIKNHPLRHHHSSCPSSFPSPEFVCSPVSHFVYI